ncbi:F-box/kelch-repeat protein At3g23880-like [Camellia sinensis]|uniref:F-box/kelch-repeat protein At3g23880-like n=1 Tax=Camellia sinensis TaxID=4442 RepID=UPI001036E599|nr:F-box/kelch-repeat protein At3g23880-like [Camellia sinensis]
MVLAEVPEEVMMSEILTRLPVRSVLRFRCVCKQWCSSMATPQFIREHLRKSKSSSSSNNRRIMIAGYDNSGFVFKSMSVYSKPPFSGCLVAYNNYPWSNRNPARIQGSCDGLFCLTTRRVPGIHIWNPSTREHKTLPSFMKKGWCGFGFGYDHSIHAFKVFAMRSCGVEQIQVHVYTLETTTTTTTTTSRSGSLLSDDSCSEDLYQIPSDSDSDDPGPFYYSEYEYLYESESESETESEFESVFWRRIQDFPYHPPPCSPGKLVNGALHWPVYFGPPASASSSSSSSFLSPGDLRIASIDVTKETYGEIPMPYQLQEDRHSGYLYTGFEVLRGCICLIFNQLKIGCDVWAMTEYGVRDSWTKLVTIPHLPSTFIFQPLLSLDDSNGEIIFLENNSQTGAYNSSENIFPALDIVDDTSLGQVYSYFETLISPNAA